MTSQEFNKVVNQLDETANQIVSVKRPDYTRESADVLQNFKDAAEQAGILPLQAWLIHFYKQYSAIARFIKNPQCTPSETIDSRFADLRNYLQLGYALYKEPREQSQSKSSAANLITETVEFKA